MHFGTGTLQGRGLYGRVRYSYAVGSLATQQDMVSRQEGATYCEVAVLHKVGYGGPKELVCFVAASQYNDGVGDNDDGDDDVVHHHHHAQHCAMLVA